MSNLPITSVLDRRRRGEGDERKGRGRTLPLRAHEGGTTRVYAARMRALAVLLFLAPLSACGWLLGIDDVGVEGADAGVDAGPSTVSTAPRPTCITCRRPRPRRLPRT
jgi:hypothetical protein